MNYLVVSADFMEQGRALSCVVYADFPSAREVAEKTDSMIVPLADLRALLFNEGVNYKAFMRELEHTIFDAAMKEANKLPTRAARMLGMKHERLTAALSARHPDIERTPIKKRSIIKKRKKRKHK